MSTTETITDMLAAQFARLRSEIDTAITRAGERASGKTQASMEVERVSDWHYILTGRPAFWTLERGRAGGRVPRGFVGIIRQWILDKGIAVAAKPYKRKPSPRWSPKYTPQERGLRSMAGAIAYKIQKQGTALHRKGGRKDVYTPAIDKTINEVTKVLQTLFTAQYTSINDKLKQK